MLATGRLHFLEVLAAMVSKGVWVVNKSSARTVIGGQNTEEH